MTKPKLCLFEGLHDWHVAWWDEGDEGAWLGQEHKLPFSALQERRQKEKQARDWLEFEYLSVELAAREWFVKQRPAAVAALMEGYSIDQRRDAVALLAVARAAAKAARLEFDDIVWPDWALQAQAAGWKPPKNWKP